MQLHSVNKKDPTKKFMGRKIKAAEHAPDEQLLREDNG
jgi:hypothetical protein